MTIALSSPVTGTAVTGLTSPTYTVTVDISPDTNAKSWIVTALGGTQTGVRTHSVSDPFTISYWRPKVLKTLPFPNSITGRYANIGSNDYSQVVRKGMNYAANQPPLVGISRLNFTIPAGSDAYDTPNVNALVSATLGSAVQQADGLATACKTGSI